MQARKSPAAVVAVAVLVGVSAFSCAAGAADRPAGGAQGTAAAGSEPRMDARQARNGRIIRSGRRRPEWDAFDQRTGSFFYAGTDQVLGPGTDPSRVAVVDQDGNGVEFDCPASADCGFIDTFGPGPNAVTVTATPQASEARSVQILTLDGNVRDTLDIPAGITRGQNLTDLAWSPDGTQLAVSTEPRSCWAGSTRCRGKVWIVDRDGGEGQPVFAQGAPGPPPESPLLLELAWSPDGHSLSVLVTSSFPGDAAERGVWPRLVVLRLSHGRRVRAETLHVYDDVKMPPWNAFQEHRSYFASAWSPDGARIAVTSRGGFAEISADDGHLLARHARKHAAALIAWLPKA